MKTLETDSVSLKTEMDVLMQNCCALGSFCPVVIRRQMGIYVGEQLFIKVKCEINCEYRTEWEREKSEKRSRKYTKS